METLIMKIALDLDGVTFDSIQSWLDRYHPTHSPDEIQDWNAWMWIDECNNKEQFFDEFGRQNPKNIQLIPDAREIILQLEQDGHDLFFLTSKSERGQQWSEKVLYREGLNHIPLINCWIEQKQKTDYNYDVLLDDCPLLKDDGRQILFRQPWNQYKYYEQEVFDWIKFYEIINFLNDLELIWI